MDYLIRILDDSITGIIYFGSLFFFFLSYIKKYDLEFIKNHKDMILYYIILIVLISHLIMGVVGSMSSHIITTLYPGVALDIEKIVKSKTVIPQNILDTRNLLYAGLTFYRHLFCSILLLGISLFIWFRVKVNKKRTAIITVLLSSISLLGYCFSRQDFIAIRDAINKTFMQ